MAHTPDAVTSKDAGGNQFHPHSEGTHGMLCVDVVDLGLRLEQFAGQPTRESPKVALVFASGEANDDGSLIIVTAEMTSSLNEKSNLRRFLESWRGKSYTAEQAEAGVPLHKLHGQAALITVEHKRTKRDRIFANIRSVSPLPKGMAAPDKETLERYERPQFLSDRKKQYADEVAKYRASIGADVHEPTVYGEDDDDSSLPF
jgi:hypothetical protein